MKKQIIATTLAGLLIGVGAGQANASGYTFTDLGTLGGNSSWANGINDYGQVVGNSITSSDAIHATIWDGTALHTKTDLGTLGGSSSYANGINNYGQVVGYIFLGSTQYATIWYDTTPGDSGTLGGSSSQAYGINNSGQVVGYSGPGGNFDHATIWDTKLNTKTDLGTLGGNWSTARGINNAGQVAGISDAPSNYQATIWNGTTPTALGTLGGWYSWANGINDYGQVVGGSYISGDSTESHATIWNGTTPTDLGTLGGSLSNANGINDYGQVVGWSYTLGDYVGISAFHATIWDGTALHKPTDLNDFLTVSEVNAGWVLIAANGINDNGWIVGNAYNSRTDAEHAFLLTPVPEPEIYALLMAGLGLMGFIARRRKNGQAA